MIECITEFTQDEKNYSLIGHVPTILVALIVAYYTANKNWKQERYFKIQEKAEEVISLIRRREELNQQYVEKVKEADFLGRLRKDSGEIEGYDEKKYSNCIKYLEKISNEKQITYEKIFAKIHIYFSENKLSKIRDYSIEVSREINLHKDDVNTGEKLRKLSKMIEIESRRSGRSTFSNFWHYLTDKYDNY